MKEYFVVFAGYDWKSKTEAVYSSAGIHTCDLRHFNIVRDGSPAPQPRFGFGSPW